MNVLVTGGAGLLGSHLVEQLKERDCKVFATYHKRKPPVQDQRIIYTQGDLRDPSDCTRIFDGIDTVFLCAANTGGLSKTLGSAKPIIDTLKINAQLLELCAERKVKRVFLISSTTVYPNLATPAREGDAFTDDPCDPYFGIGWMNRYLEKLATYYRNEFGLLVTIIRPSNLYGPYDNFSAESAHVIPSLIRKFIQAEDTVEIWGNGSQQRDFIYAGDVASLLLALLDKPQFGGPINVGNGSSITIEQLAREVAVATGQENIKIVFDYGKPIGIPIRTLDVSLAQATLNFFPQHTLQAGLKKTVHWFKHSHNGRSL
jgi:GDP-L-fucose synthase